MLRDFLDDFSDILLNYRKNLPRIAEKKNIWHGLLVYYVVTLVVSLTTLDLTPAAIYFNMERFPSLFYSFFHPQTLEIAGSIMPLLTLLFQLVFAPVYFLLLVAVLYFAAALFGGNNSVSSLGAVIGYAYLPYLIVVIAGLLRYYTTLDITVLLIIVALCWSLWLRISGLKQLYNFPWGRAALVYFIPLLTLLVAFILFVLLVIVFLIPLLIKL